LQVERERSQPSEEDQTRNHVTGAGHS
jgi:hypothetical protein